MTGKKYETGIATRKLILEESRKLFLEKGFRATGYDDICKAAHVNRGSIYYHFKQKEVIRYEIMWEIFTENKKSAEAYTALPSHQCAFALYLMWRQILTDPKIGRFLVDYYLDYPVYLPQNDFPFFITTIYRNLLGDIIPVSQVDEFTMASMYGYLGAVCRMIKDNPERFPIDILFPKVLQCCFRILSVPEEKTVDMTKDLERCIKAFSEINA